MERLWPRATLQSCTGTAKVQAQVRDWTHSFTLGRFLLLVSAFLFALYPDVILGSHSFFDRDFALFTYPVAYYAREQIWHGRIPLWNTLSDCGIPFLAQWNTGVCYPLAWFYFLLPLPWSLNYFCLGHLLLAGWGMYLLARHWTANPFAASVAGLAYALNGVALNCLMWTSNLAALAWLPFVVLYVSRAWTEGGRMIVVGSLAGAMQALAGAPEIVLVTWLILGTLWVAQSKELSFKVSFLRLALVGVLVGSLSAVQLLPFFQLATHSDRTAAQGNSAWAMPADGTANFLVPLFHCSKTTFGSYFQLSQQWTSSYYIGIGIVALAIIGAWKARSTRTYWLILVAVLGVLVSLGDHTFVYPVTKRVMPLFGLARYPIKFVIATIFALPLLAAFGVTWASTQETGKLRRCVSLCAACLLGAIMVILVFARVSPAADEVWKATLMSGGSRAAFLLCSLAMMVFICKTPNSDMKRFAGFALLALMGLDSITHTSPQNPTVRNSAYGPLAGAMNPVPLPGQSRAMVSLKTVAVLDRASFANPMIHCIANRGSLFQNWNLIDDIPKANGFFSLHVREQAAVNSLVYQPTDYPSGLIDFMGVQQLSADDQLCHWVFRTSAMPLITGGQRPIFADSQQTLKALASAAFNAREIVYLPADAVGKVSATNKTLVQIQQREFSGSRIAATANAQAAALIVISQSQYPAWKAFVDGRPVPLWHANHAFQAFEIPAGEHQIRLEYHDTAFHAGVAITGLSLLVCIALFQRHSRPHAPILATV